MTSMILSLTLLNREAMDEDVVPAVASHLLNLSVHLKHLMSLIIVLKLLIKNRREHLLQLRIGKGQEVPHREVLLHHDHDHHHRWFHHRKCHRYYHLHHHHLAPNVLDLGSEARNLPNRISNFSSRQVLHNLMNTSATHFLFSTRVLLLTSELCAFVFCFYYEARV